MEWVVYPIMVPLDRMAPRLLDRLFRWEQVGRLLLSLPLCDPRPPCHQPCWRYFDDMRIVTLKRRGQQREHRVGHLAPKPILLLPRIMETKEMWMEAPPSRARREGMGTTVVQRLARCLRWMNAHVLLFPPRRRQPPSSLQDWIKWRLFLFFLLQGGLLPLHAFHLRLQLPLEKTRPQEEHRNIDE